MEGTDADDNGEPIARRACQVVYNPSTQTFYLHGGTGQTRHDPTRGAAAEGDERLDDFWSMKLERSGLRDLTGFCRADLHFHTCTDLLPKISLDALYLKFGDNSASSRKFRRSL